MKKFILFSILAMLMIGMAGATYTTLTPTTPDYLNDYGTMQAGVSLAGNGSIDNFAMPGGFDYVLIATITSVMAGNPTLRYINVMAGDNPPAFRSGIGNLSVASVSAGTYFIGPLESARFKNTTGYCEISSKNVTATIQVLKIPQL